MIDAVQIAALIAVLSTAVVFGTDVFCALVQRPALARVDDRALTAVMGNVHRYGDRRMPIPGALGIVAAIYSVCSRLIASSWSPSATRTSALIALS